MKANMSVDRELLSVIVHVDFRQETSMSEKWILVTSVST